MPIGDHETYLYDDVPDDDSFDGVALGPCPINGMLLRLHVEEATTATVVLEEYSEAEEDWLVVPLGNMGGYVVMDGDEALGPAYAEQRVWWSNRILRVTLSGSSGEGNLNVSLLRGAIPTPAEGPLQQN